MLNKPSIALIFIVFFFSSCYTRKLKDGQYLLDKNKISSNDKRVDKDELKSVIKQRPNKKIFSVVKFHLMLHNMMDSTNVSNREIKKVKRKNKRINRRNKRRVKKNKELIPLKTSDNFDSFGEKILYSIGESPVVVSKSKSKKSAQQIHLSLIRKGFFNNEVKDSIRYIDSKFFGLKKKRAEVIYYVNVLDPYTIKSIEYKSKDTVLLKKINLIQQNSKLKIGNVFDIDELDEERERLSTYFLNDGYYKFSKNFIKYYVDSTVGENQVSLVLDVDLFKEKTSVKDSIKSSPHSQFFISSVNVNYFQDKSSIHSKSFSYKGIDFFVVGKNNISSNLFYHLIFLRPGDLFSKEKQQQTFRRLTSIGVFLTVNITTSIDTIGKSNQLVLNINIGGSKIKSTKAEGSATTSGSTFGIEGSYEFNHGNVFRGAETFHIGVSGALESQPQILGSGTNENNNIPVQIESFSNLSSAFNTIEFGPELSFTIPRLLFLSTRKYVNVSNTKTIFSASASYQRRLNNTTLDYERGIQEVSYGYSWTVKDKMRHQLDPISLSGIEVNKSEAFEERINSLNDKLLAASFQSHIISATRYRFIYSDPSARNKSKFSASYEGGIESSGNILNMYSKLNELKRDDNTGSYELFGVPFSQYIKTQHDFRLYNKINDKSNLVFRFLGGVGVPLENSSRALPFEKSFFAGGSDKNRAWKARSLGPGSYRDSVLVFDKIGEVLLEGNLEYRFDLLGFIDGALFVDAGNIWLLHEDSLRPGSKFEPANFLSQIAVGGGFGLRVDLSFLIIRFDFAYPLKNPSLVEGERWIFQKKDEYESYLRTLSNPQNAPRLYPLQFNIGIGYPF